MNETLHTMHTRRSVRKYKADAVPKELLEQIVQAGLDAPSGRNRQPAVIVAITEKETVARLSKANAAIMGSTSDPFYGAPAVLVVLCKKDAPTYLYDGPLVMENMMLAAHALGLGACWIHRAKETFELPEWMELLCSLGLDGDYEGIGNCIVGYPDGDLSKELPRREGRVFWVE